jgi:hypothetical protein
MWEDSEMQGTGLEMTGLSIEMQTDCRGIHRRFLDEHALSEWPVKIAVSEEATARISGSGEAGSVTTTPRQYPALLEAYILVIKSGVGGQSRMTITMSPGVDLQRMLALYLEVDYQNREKKTSASGA